MGTDEELLRAWQSGDKAAGGELLRRHFSGVRRFFLGKIDAIAADDLSQRTFEAIVRLRDDVRMHAGFRSLVFGVARLELLRHLEEWQRRGARFDPLETSLVALGIGPVTAVAGAELHARVSAAMSRLPLDFQLTLELHYWEDLSFPEVAASLGIAVGTVKSRMSRARSLLAAELGLDDADAIATLLGEARDRVAPKSSPT